MLRFLHTVLVNSVVDNTGGQTHVQACMCLEKVRAFVAMHALHAKRYQQEYLPRLPLFRPAQACL